MSGTLGNPRKERVMVTIDRAEEAQIARVLEGRRGQFSKVSRGGTSFLKKRVPQVCARCRYPLVDGRPRMTQHRNSR